MEKQLRVLIGDAGDTLAAVLAHDLQRYNVWAIIRPQNLENLLSSVRTDHPDVLIMNLTQATVDFQLLTEQVRQISVMHLAALYKCGNTFLEAALRRMDVTCWRIPAEVEALSRAIIRKYRPQNPACKPVFPGEISPQMLKLDITGLLHAARVPVNLSGFQFLRCVIEKAFQRDDAAFCPIQELYEETADLFNTSASRVERCIRSAISQVGGTDSSAFSPLQFQFCKKHMTNSEFVSLAVDWLRMIYEQRTIR